MTTPLARATKILRQSWQGMFLALLPIASAEVVRVEIAQRVTIGASGYEKISGTLHFAVDPADPRNAIVADLSLAPVNVAGRVEFSSDFFLTRPLDPSRSNGSVLVEVPNRGSRSGLRVFNRGGRADPETEADMGDGFLFRHGFTMMSVGWEFDAPKSSGAMRIKVPVATEQGKPIRGIVRASISVSSRVNTFTVTDLSEYAPSDSRGLDSRLTVRASASKPGGQEIPRDRWRLEGNKVTLDGGFAPSRIYDLSYQAMHPPIAGLGFAAVRDAVAWLKHAGDSPAPVRHALSFGSSQSGRFLRTFVYLGFNTDERDRMVFDGVLAHVAGAARLDLNRRWSTPREQAMYNAAGFPFADTRQLDPISGLQDGMLENPRVTRRPKMFYTNSAAEYWGGGRVGALAYTDPTGTRDIPLPDDVRLYVFAGTQHGPAAFPPPADAVVEAYGSPVSYWPGLRALLLALHRWVRDGAPPPPSAYPTLRNGVLVPVSKVVFPTVPGVKAPLRIDGGVRVPNPLYPDGAGAGAALPLLVPQVDRDGNDIAGIRALEVAVPLATYTGWCLGASPSPDSDQLVPLRGTWIPFAATAAARKDRGDPRPSIEERYASRQAYLARTQVEAESLVKRGYALPEDREWMQRRAAELWDWTLAQR